MKERLEYFLREYGISSKNGFLPETTPLRRLDDPYYTPWEAIIGHLPELVANEQARSKIDDLPILETTNLKLDAEWQRAYVILGFLTHAYIWEGDCPSEIVPPQLTCPFLSVSEYVGLPPTATYATLSLWNYDVKTPSCGLAEPENLSSLHTLTGTKDEEWFYLISTAVEAKGSSLILGMLRCIQAVVENDSRTILSCLDATTTGINDLGIILGRMHEHCDPQIFYHKVRPLLAGSKGMAAAGLARGVFYDEGNGQGQWRQYSGGSNAQSSLIQVLDIFLGVDHHATGGSEASPGIASKNTPRANGFILEMRKYMPRAHREFLAHVSQMSNVREYISLPSVEAGIRQAYNNAVAALVNFRSIHLQIVARYIVMPSRGPPAPYIAQGNRMNLATASSASLAPAKPWEVEKRHLTGTGGTNLMPFLKRTRDETRDAVVI
ncbi:uncharacterized protein Z518_05843 [Rhinocladiella mackenziei CBS 650.93]|uniref:Indoleamine 2,3-dioxygenase n=1 Tax=Rhinocladiella mackenziei CBS 650.93 TaxID=1442369 RepID=A0A0D2IP96_9EURO|nr:uncharacterized protein Z518_05843 [Rhinocladiella mackenziei CBS 650.93]KIX04971.1 hypothetical protein Z518_05843 [Rhinocladiella mackenziei CBS 650.93]